MQETLQLNLELLTQGSTWVRKNGTEAHVLFVTNTTVPEHQQANNPVMVVYANDEGNIYSRTLESFFKFYTFYNVNAALESRLENLFVFSEEAALATPDDTEVENIADQASAQALEKAEEDAKAFDLVLDTEEKSNKGVIASWLAENDTDKPTNDTAGQWRTTFVMSEGKPVLTPEQLGYALVSYSQDPNKNFDMTQHRLLFSLSPQVTLDALQQTFLPQEGYSGVDAFEVSTPYFTQFIAWTDFIGVFPEVVAGIAYATVIVGTHDIHVVADEAAESVESAGLLVDANAEQVPVDLELDPVTQEVVDTLMTIEQGTPPVIEGIVLPGADPDVSELPPQFQPVTLQVQPGATLNVVQQ